MYFTTVRYRPSRLAMGTLMESVSFRLQLKTFQRFFTAFFNNKRDLFSCLKSGLVGRLYSKSFTGLLPILNSFATTLYILKISSIGRSFLDPCTILNISALKSSFDLVMISPAKTKFSLTQSLEIKTDFGE